MHKKNREEKLSEEMMQIFQKLMKNNNSQIQEVKLIPSRISTFEKLMHITAKLKKTNTKKKILKALTN